MAGNATVVIISTTTTTDQYGDSTATTTETAWEGAAVAPRYSNESPDAQSPQVVIGRAVYGPPIAAAVALDADDQLRIDGVVYDVVGDAGDWKSPFTGWHPGVEVAVERASAV